LPPARLEEDRGWKTGTEVEETTVVAEMMQVEGMMPEVETMAE